MAAARKRAAAKAMKGIESLMAHPQIRDPKPLDEAAAAAVQLDPDRICALLAEIEKNEENYAVRYALVFELMHVAQKEPYEYKTGIRVDPKEPKWPVFWVILPGVGEVSWHMPSDDGNYDGYDTKAKYTRVRDYIAST